MGRVHVLAVLKMVRADSVLVVQLLCRFLGPVKNNDVAARVDRGGVNIVLLICQPNHFNEYLL